MTALMVPPVRGTKFYERISETIRERMALHYRPDSCIAATVITIRVLRLLGIKAKALPLGVIVVNEPLDRRLREEYPDHIPNPGRIHHRPGTSEWCVVISGRMTDAVGRTPPPGTFSSHLAAFTEDNYLVDPTLDQMTRVQAGIAIPREGLVVRVPREFAKGTSIASGKLSTGCGVYLWAEPERDAYKTAPNWTERGLPYGVAEDVLRVLNREEDGE